MSGGQSDEEEILDRDGCYRTGGCIASGVFDARL